MRPRIHSTDLQHFHDIERALWRLFGCFGPLCGRCARKTLREHAVGDRSARVDWCCCMIDNQVHDHWDTLNPVQSHYDRKWYEKLVPLPLGRMPGNGPCPALGEAGCRLRRCRPVTCTTQLCNKMLKVLAALDLYAGPTESARQIEEFVALPDILFALYGARRDNRKVPVSDVQVYLDAIHGYRRRLEAVPAARLCAAIDAVLPDDGGA
ncbi:MAG: hypothetical protein ACNA71_04455 [Kiritimatiellia bacterium]